MSFATLRASRDELKKHLATVTERVKKSGVEWNRTEASNDLTSILAREKAAAASVAPPSHANTPSGLFDTAEAATKHVAQFERQWNGNPDGFIGAANDDAADEQKLQRNKAYRKVVTAPIVKGAPDADKLKYFQDLNDGLYLMSVVYKRPFQSAPYEWAQYKRLAMEFRSMVEKAAYDTNVGGGLEWVPTQMSSQLLERMRLRMIVPQLFPRFRMPTLTYTYPMQGADKISFKIPERQADNPYDIDGATLGYFKAFTLSSTNVTWTAKKHGARTGWSDELDADSIVAMPNVARDEMARALAIGVEEVTINGDDTAGSGGIDPDVTDVSDVRKLFKGLRKLSNLASWVDNGGVAIDPAKMLLTQGVLGKYGLGGANNLNDPNSLVWILSTNAVYGLIGNTNFLTRDKYGDAFTLLSGEVGRVYGIPIIASDRIRMDLHTTGKYSTVTADAHDRTIAILVRPDRWMYGDREVVEMEDFRMPIVGQRILVAKQRFDFQPLEQSATNNTVAILRNIKPV